jgi:hypothetical protein
LDIQTILMLDRCTVCTEHTMLRNCFGCTGSASVPQAKKLFSMHLMELLDARLKSKLVSVRLEIVLILTQGTCTVYAEHTDRAEIILDALEGTPMR